MYECLTGQNPYQSGGNIGMVDLLTSVIEGPAPRLDPKKFDLDLCEAVEAMLQKDPKQRPKARWFLEKWLF